MFSVSFCLYRTMFINAQGRIKYLVGPVSVAHEMPQACIGHQYPGTTSSEIESFLLPQILQAITF